MAALRRSASVIAAAALRRRAPARRRAGRVEPLVYADAFPNAGPPSGSAPDDARHARADGVKAAQAGGRAQRGGDPRCRASQADRGCRTGGSGSISGLLDVVCPMAYTQDVDAFARTDSRRRTSSPATCRSGPASAPIALDSARRSRTSRPPAPGRAASSSFPTTVLITPPTAPLRSPSSAAPRSESHWRRGRLRREAAPLRRSRGHFGGGTSDFGLRDRTRRAFMASHSAVDCSSPLHRWADYLVIGGYLLAITRSAPGSRASRRPRATTS